MEVLGGYPSKSSSPKTKTLTVLLSMTVGVGCLFLLQSQLRPRKPTDFYSFEVKDAKGRTVPLEKYRGKVSPQRHTSGFFRGGGGGTWGYVQTFLVILKSLKVNLVPPPPLPPSPGLSPFSLPQASLVVNVASHSERTEENYASLQELHRELGTSHFNVLAFPCGQFGETEPGTSRDIEAFAKSVHGVTFPFFGKIKIMGSEADPAFKFLTGWYRTEPRTDRRVWNLPQCHVSPSELQLNVVVFIVCQI